MKRNFHNLAVANYGSKGRFDLRVSTERELGEGRLLK